VNPSRRRRRAFSRVALFLALCFGVALTSTFTLAQSKPKTAKPAAKKVKPDASSGEMDVDAASAPMTTKGESVTRRSGVVEDAGTGVQGAVVEQKTLDGGGKVFRFGEIEIEGRLKSPQLVYFLRRVRAEFAAGDLGHRTFMRELSDTRTDPSF
jgi:hypothetical protein